MDNSRSYYGGDRGGDRHRPYRRGGRGRGGGGYQGGGGHRHQPYRGRGGGGPGGHGGGRGNRFASQQQTDPETTLFRQIASFVSRVGEFQKLQEASPNEDGSPQLRSVEFTASSNINQLLPVLCDPKTMEGLLKYSPDATQPEDKVGKLVHLVVSCVADLPLQTPCYAALTLAIHEQVKNSAHQGFAIRCLQYTMLQVAKELDVTLLASNPKPAKSTCRLKLLLRYLCIMAHMGLVAAYDGETTVDPNHMTIFGFISVLVDAATAAAEQFHNFPTACWLALMVLSSLPYLLETQLIPDDVIENRIRKPLEQLLTNYKSTFTPGTGITAVLLKEPQVEEDDDEEPDDAEEEEEEEGDGPQLICDSLQDLLRATKYWRKEGQPSQFALPLDAPWKGLTVQTSSNPDSGEEMESRPLQYTDAPLYLAFPQECQLLNLLLSGAGSDSPLKLQFFSLEGAVFGRLPIFGSPPDPETQNDDDDDEEDMEEAVIKNKQLETFRAMSLLDRYFVAESIRDCLVSHASHVNGAGLQFGSAKSAAEELLLVYHVFNKTTTQEGEDPSQGIEYAILETLFSLLAQATDTSSLRHIYLSRIILELIRLEPSRISQALAIAMTNLFQDYLPALVPAARENFSRWFAFHLTNTDYQWPSAYWQLWEPYATSDKPSSRGTFVRRSLNLMAENLADPIPIVKQSFGGVAQSLVKELLGRTLLPLDLSPDEAIEGELQRRLWDNREDPIHVLEFMQSGQVGEALGSGGWPRTDIFLRVLLQPARQLHQITTAALEKAVGEPQESDNAMEDDTAFSKDVHVLVTGAIQQYKETLLGAMEKDAENKGGDRETIRAQGGAYLLRCAESILSFNSSLLEGVVVALLQNRILEGISVFKWALRDVGDSVIAPIVPCWYTYSVIAIRESLLLVANEATAGGIMTLDSGNATEDEFVSKVTLTPVACLHYATRRVCSLLVTTQQNETKLKPIQVELVEGLKYLVFTTKKLVYSALLHPPAIRNPLSASDIEVVMSKSDMSGASLAAICSVDETSPAVSLLKKSLEDL